MNEAPIISFSTNDTRSTPTHEQISERAQQLWVSYGRPSGRDEEIWLAAESQLKAPSPAFNDGSTPPSSSRSGQPLPASSATPNITAQPTARATQRPTPARRTAGKAAGR